MFQTTHLYFILPSHCQINRKQNEIQKQIRVAQKNLGILHLWLFHEISDHHNHHKSWLIVWDLLANRTSLLPFGLIREFWNVNLEIIYVVGVFVETNEIAFWNFQSWDKSLKDAFLDLFYVLSRKQIIHYSRQ